MQAMHVSGTENSAVLFHVSFNVCQVSYWNKIMLKFEHNIKLSAASFKKYLTETAFKTQEDGRLAQY